MGPVLHKVLFHYKHQAMIPWQNCLKIPICTQYGIHMEKAVKSCLDKKGLKEEIVTELDHEDKIYIGGKVNSAVWSWIEKKTEAHNLKHFSQS